MENSEIMICKIVKVVNQYKIVINKGSDDGIKEGYKFLVYQLGEELYDPDTKASLGILEIVKGYGKATHIQNKLTTIESTKKIKNPGTKKIVKNNSSMSILTGNTETITYEENEEIVPFENVKKGDYAKYIP